MTKTAQIIADHLRFQAHHLYEKSSEHPECKAENDKAAKEINDLEALFRNYDCNQELCARFGDLFDDDGGSDVTQAYGRLLNDVGFRAHFVTADDFLAAAIAAMEKKSSYGLGY